MLRLLVLLLKQMLPYVWGYTYVLHAAVVTCSMHLWAACSHRALGVFASVLPLDSFFGKIGLRPGAACNSSPGARLAADTRDIQRKRPAKHARQRDAKSSNSLLFQ